ncbi:hypothetical protein OG985_16055 [Streptomyces sp. NBC_00289]|uniref:hypothetical protein n=1 Tax=Streptomyces sp. NBC_00289 TaxID=2975703 RepID=UPI003246F7D8
MLLGGTCAVLLTVGAAGAAQAGTSSGTVATVTNSSGRQVGELTFVDDGDDFYVWDEYADGHGVRGEIHYAGTKLASAYDGTGADGTIAHFHYDITPGTTYFVEVCTVDGANDTTPVACGTGTVTE